MRVTAPDREAAFAAGCDAFAAKPLRMAELLATLTAQLGRGHGESASDRAS